MQCVEPLALQQADEEADGEAAHFLQRLADGCEQGPGGLGEVDVVEAGDGEVLGYAQSALRGRGQRADGDLVVEPDQRGGAPWQVEQSTLARMCGA